MNKVVKRLLTFFIGVPLILFLVCFDFFSHLPLQIVLIVLTFFAANELYNMFSNKVKIFPKALLLSFTTLLPLISYIFILTGISLEVTPWILTFELIVLMAIEAFFSKSFEFSTEKISRSFFLITYGGFLITFISRMTILENSKYLISLFLILVFMCDSAAWFFGILFGKNNRGIFPASPNKSIAGFVGGILSSVACGVIFKLLFPKVITAEFWKVIITGFLTAISAIAGDIIESVLKRSAQIKDSGNLIPGRGGVLDSIDSIIVSAPVFYIAQHFLFY